MNEKKKKRGASKMMKREQRVAWMLLGPSFLLIVLVAIYPLGSAFLKSFTNEIFASDAPMEFVGLENYMQLLGLTIKKLPPRLSFNITQESLTKIAGEEVPSEILTQLESLKDKEYKDKKKLIKALETTIGKEQTTQYTSLIVKHLDKTIQHDPKTGKVLYESPVRILPRKPIRYKQAGQFGFWGTRYVIGARDPVFILAIRDTLIFTVMSVFLETVIGMGFALIVNANFPGRGAMRALMLVPWAIPTAISSRMWQWMFNSTRAGFLNVILQMSGLGDGQIAFLQMEQWQVPAMIAVDVWKTTPFMTLLLLAGLQLIPQQLYEAAEVDGANKLQQFWSITLPLLRPTLAVALVFRTLDSLRVFDLFQIVLGQSRFSMASFVYYELINNRAAGYSSAAGVIIFLLLFVFAISYIKMLGVQKEEH